MLVAVVISLALVLAAPFIGEFRRWVASTLPGQYVWIVNGAVGLIGAAVGISAFVCIRDRRPARFGLIAGERI